MTQKDNVKQLIGKSLNAYNNKVLQQIDRIEKKNKQQNHKISMLTNELDNDYLTKTEEGSVISLEHSKEGMVYIDSLEGNTLVNYCTDGSKELTLNGDIDLEGTFVTTTEGVDNGLVDVMCEGNTLVNIANNETVNGTRRNGNIIITPTKQYSQFSVTHSELMSKLNTTYTIRIEVLSNTSTVPLVANKYNGTFNGWNGIEVGFTGEKIFTYTTGSEYQYTRWFWVENNVVGEGEIEIRLTILEGDWTDKEIPPYFEGMKSVGQDDENVHKIEILSKNKNLFNPEEVYGSAYSYGVPFVNSVKCQEEDGVFTTVTPANSWNAGIGFHIKTEKNKDYTLSVGEYFNDGVNMELRCIGVYKSEYPFKSNNNIQSYVDRIASKNLDSNNNSLTYNSKDYDYILFYIGGKWDENANGVKTFKMSKIEVNQSSTKPTNYTKQNLNKKEILLNDPLRGLPNGVRDRFVKIGGKSYIERNCVEVVLDGSDDETYGNAQNTDGISYRQSYLITPYAKFMDNSLMSLVVSDRLPTQTFSHCYTGEKKGVSIWGNSTPNGTHLVISNGFNNADELRNWLKSNPLTVVYQLITPTYEPLEIEPTLNTYNDIAHISNNSIIPCNMKIKNSGYNTIIKPSTLYTVALDTNKSGTIEMNLGGVKGTTTNNVLTLTTPATLTDDSLRLYGKGIKGSKVRLLEGDKTNWIPSFFEGMKSCFEDKVQEDGTYKMEILSNNKNLLDLDKLLNANNYLKGTYSSIKIPLKPNTKYYFNFKFKPNNINRWIGIFSEPLGYNGAFIKTFVWNENIDEIKQGTFITDNSTEYYLSVYQPSVSYNDNNWYKELFTNVYEDFIISQVDDNYIEGKSNKIQFLSIEPLRSVDNIKDRFIFKDNKLMIERNCREIEVNGSLVWNGYDTSVTPKNPRGYFIIEDCYYTQHDRQAKSDKFTLLHSDLDITHFKVHAFQDTKTIAWYYVPKASLETENMQGFKKYMENNPSKLVYPIKEPIYEEIPYELQKIILEGYENGTLFFDTNIPPTSTTTYAGETPIVKSVKLNKTEVLNNTKDINDNIIPYLMDMDYRVVCLQLQSEGFNGGIEMARIFGGTYEMLKRDIQSNRLSKEEYGYRLIDYFNAGKLTEEEVRELEDLK